MLSIYDFLNIYSVAGCALALLWYYSQSAYGFWRKLNVKYLEPVPFLGNTAKMSLQLTPLYLGYDKFYKALYDEPFGGIYELRKPQLIAKDPELVSAILVRDFKHFYNHGHRQLIIRDRKTNPLLTHIFFSEDERWRVLRQKMSPVFTSGKLKQMHGQIMACVNLLLEYIDDKMEADAVDVELKGLFQKLTNNVIGSCAFGIECNAFMASEKFSQMSKEVFKPRFVVTLRILLSTVSQRLANLSRIRFLRREVDDFYLNLALDTVDYRRRNGVSRNDLLQLLMELQNCHVDPKFAVDQQSKVLQNEEFDEIDIAANAFAFFLGSFETTAGTLSFCIYELALNQVIQEKLRSEILQMKDKSQNLTYDMLREMNYLAAVIDETLRKYPPVTFLSRECTEEYLIPGTKVKVPVGTEVIIPVWSIQHDWRYYPNPEVFDPERFLGDNKYSNPSGAYLPFGEGPRFCIGKRFAEMTIKAVIFEIIAKYDIKPCAKTEIPLTFKCSNLFLETAGGCWVELLKRID